MDSLLFGPALVGLLKQFLISITIHLKSAKKKILFNFYLAGKLDSVLLSYDIQPEATNKICNMYCLTLAPHVNL